MIQLNDVVIVRICLSHAIRMNGRCKNVNGGAHGGRCRLLQWVGSMHREGVVTLTQLVSHEFSAWDELMPSKCFASHNNVRAMDRICVGVGVQSVSSLWSASAWPLF